MAGVFKADGDETGGVVSVSEWVLEPGSDGVHPHHHDDALELFYVTAGTLQFLVGEEWIEVSTGSFLQLPPGKRHAFNNPTDEPAAVLSLKVPGGFEEEVAGWYARNRS